MKRHQRRLADAEHAQREQAGERTVAELAAEDATGREVGAAGDEPDEHQRRQQEEDRRAHQQAEIDAPAAARGVGAVMRDERVGDQRQQLVEDEQREQVAGERDAHRRRQREREADVKARLVHFAVAAHVADRVQRVDDPQARRDQREQHAQRLDLQGDGQARQHRGQGHARPRALHHRRQQRGHAQQQGCSCGQRDAFAQVRPARGRSDERGAERRHGKRRDDGVLRCRHHQRAAPINAAAACAAGTALNDVSRPK